MGVIESLGAGERSGFDDALSCWARSSIRNAHSIHQRSRKRLSQDAYRRNSVRFLQQRRRQARPGPQSPGSPLGECLRSGEAGSALGAESAGVGARGRNQRERRALEAGPEEERELGSGGGVRGRGTTGRRGRSAEQELENAAGRGQRSLWAGPSFGAGLLTRPCSARRGGAADPAL